MGYPSISVVIVVKNEEEYIKECMDSLFNQDYPKENYEIIVVDGMSTDNTQNIIKQYPAKLILKDCNIPAARNLGIKSSKGNLIAFIDADCKADKSWLRVLDNEIAGAPKNIACVGGPNLVFDDDPTFARVVGYAQETFLGSGGSAQSNNTSDKKYVQSIPTCNALYKKSIIENVGYFDEGLLMGEDADLNYRINKNGYRFLYIPEAKVWHHRRSNLKTFSIGMFKYGEWMAELFKKHKGLVRWYALLPPITIILTICLVAISVELRSSLLLIVFLAMLYFIVIIVETLKVVNKMKSIKGIFALFIYPTQHLMYGLGMLWRFKRI